MANKTGSGWKLWLAATAAAALGFFAVIALAQTTGGASGSSGSSGGSSSGGGHSSGGGVGIGISVDLSHLLSPDSHETRPANEWQNLPQQAVSSEGGHGLIVFRPDAPEGGINGVDIRIDNSGNFDGGHFGVNWKPGMRGQPVTPLTPEGKPCPPNENTDQIKAENAALQKQIDDMKKENDALKSSVAEKAVCEEKEKDCEKKLAAANAQIASLQNQLSAAQAKAAQPGDGAKAIFVPFSVTYHNDNEIVHYGWEVIGAVFEGNGVRVENLTEDWIKKHPELRPEDIKWLRDNYGHIPEGHIDFGDTLFEGETLRDRIEHLCEPAPSQKELEAKKSVAHILGIHYNKQTQKVTATLNGKGVGVANQQITETSFDFDLTAECNWTYEDGVVKKHVMVQLSVQYQGKDGNMHEVKYVADNPQMGWVMKG